MQRYLILHGTHQIALQTATQSAWDSLQEASTHKVSCNVVTVDAEETVLIRMLEMKMQQRMRYVLAADVLKEIGDVRQEAEVHNQHHQHHQAHLVPPMEVEEVHNQRCH